MFDFPSGLWVKPSLFCMSDFPCPQSSSYTTPALTSASRRCVALQSFPGMYGPLCLLMGFSFVVCLRATPLSHIFVRLALAHLTDLSPNISH